MDELIPILILVIISVASMLFGKKREEQPEAGEEDRWEEAEAPAPPRPGTGPARRPQPGAGDRWSDLETQLREMLEGKPRSTGQSQAAPPLPSRPQPAAAIPKPPPIPVVSAGAPTKQKPKSAFVKKGACQHCGKEISFPLESIGQSMQCPHCKQATLMRVRGASVESTTRGDSPSTARRQLLAHLRTPASTRQAILAAIVLGPPRGMEEFQDKPF